MKKAFAVIIFCVLNAVVYSQNVAMVNNLPVSAKEFMWVYKKNNSGAVPASYESLKAYLELYINFKLKVLDAKALKLDKDTAYINEIKSYERLLKTKIRTRGKQEYQYIVNEYRDGVLMFNVSEKKVWYPVRSAAVGAVTEEEQRALEAEWVARLRTQYPVKILEDELHKLAKP